MRYTDERWQEIPGEYCQIKSQQETGQCEPVDEMWSGHILLYLLYQAEGTLCTLMTERSSAR